MEKFNRRNVVKSLGGLATVPGLASAKSKNKWNTQQTQSSKVTIESFNVDSGNFSVDDEVTAEIQVQSQTDSTQTHFVGFSVEDPQGQTYDNNGTTGKEVVLGGFEQETVEVSWTVEAGIPTEASYNAVTKVWAESNPPENVLAEQWEYDTFQVVTPVRGNALYVWENASSIVSDDTDQFLQHANTYGVDRVFLSWGGLTDAQRDRYDTEVDSFIDECHNAGIDVSILWGEVKGIPAFAEASDDLEAMRAHSPDAVQFDIEPDPDSDTNLSTFLEQYATFLSNQYYGDVSVEAYINPYWAEISPDLAADVHNHYVVDRVSIAAYRDTAAEIRDRIELVTGNVFEFVTGNGCDKPYYAAVELQSPSNSDGLGSGQTLWEEADQAGRIIEDVRVNHPKDQQFQGMALHYYGTLLKDQYST